MTANVNEGSKPRIYKKGDSVRVVETSRDVVNAEFDGFRRVEDSAPETEAPETEAQSETQSALEGAAPETPSEPKPVAPRGKR